jgi:glycerophosphoryl diester phosphodiesterase
MASRRGCSWLLIALFSLNAASAAEPSKRPLVVGHRGLLHAAPECTLAGFKACLNLRVGFEFDVRRTKDGQLVCLHDTTLHRTTNGDGALADITLDELRRLDAGTRFDPAFRGERVPTIDEIFTLAAQASSDATLLAVDLKETGGGLEERLVRLAEKHKVLQRLVFIGLTIESPDIRARLKAANQKAATARLAPDAQSINAAIADASADWVYVRFLPSPDDMDRIHKAGKRVFLSGPDAAGLNPNYWAQATTLGIDAILTDYPLELARQLRRP